MRYMILLFVSLAFNGNVLADLRIVVTDGFGSDSIFSSNGQLVRIESPQVPGFIIIDYASDEFFMVDMNRNEITKASLGKLDASNEIEKLGLGLKDQGGGQKIAGYPTRKYQIVANGESCGSVYVSQGFLENREVRAIFESMRSIQQFSRRMMGGMSGVLPVCQRANMQMADVIESRGAPLKIIDASGMMLSEVVSVEFDKEIGSEQYQLPAGMAVVDISDRMNQAARDNRKMMESMPEMEALMQQLQEEGQLTEEMRQQLLQLQQQMQQQQMQQ